MVLALVGSLVTSACAFGTTRPPKPDDPDDTCNTSEVGPAMDAGWAVLFGLGLIGTIADASQYNDHSTAIVAEVAIISLFTASTIYGLNNIGKCRNRDRDIKARAAAAEAQDTRGISAHDAAWQMTKQAHTAAVAGDCASARALGEVVRGTDAEFHAVIFMRDAAIARCANAPAPGAPPGAQTPTPSTPPPADQEIPVSPP